MLRACLGKGCSIYKVTGRQQSLIAMRMMSGGMTSSSLQDEDVASKDMCDWKNHLVKETTEEGITYLTLNNSAKRNPLSFKMIQDLLRELDSIEKDAKSKVVVLRSACHVFSSGHDLAQMSQSTSEFHKHLFSSCTKLMVKLRELKCPVIAEINGLATAAGAQLVGACDLAVASSKSQFVFPGAKNGFFCSTPAVELGRNMARKPALEMLFTAAPISAERALELGFVNRVVEEEELEEETKKLAGSIAKLNAKVITLGKCTFNRQMEMGTDVKGAYKIAESSMVKNLSMPEAKEGIQRFLNRPKKGGKN
eukprot:Nk52_evm6s2426 gene=Nk52_evmTU6s2426